MLKQVFFLAIVGVLLLLGAIVYFETMHPSFISKEAYRARFDVCMSNHVAWINDIADARKVIEEDPFARACDTSGGCFDPCGDACERNMFPEDESLFFVYVDQYLSKAVNEQCETRQCVQKCVCPYDKPYFREGEGCSRR